MSISIYHTSEYQELAHDLPEYKHLSLVLKHFPSALIRLILHLMGQRYLMIFSHYYADEFLKLNPQGTLAQFRDMYLTGRAFQHVTISSFEYTGDYSRTGYYCRFETVIRSARTSQARDMCEFLKQRTMQTTPDENRLRFLAWNAFSVFTIDQRNLVQCWDLETCERGDITTLPKSVWPLNALVSKDNQVMVLFDRQYRPKHGPFYKWSVTNSHLSNLDTINTISEREAGVRQHCHHDYEIADDEIFLYELMVSTSELTISRVSSQKQEIDYITTPASNHLNCFCFDKVTRSCYFSKTTQSMDHLWVVDFEGEGFADLHCSFEKILYMAVQGNIIAVAAFDQNKYQVLIANLDRDRPFEFTCLRSEDLSLGKQEKIELEFCGNILYFSSNYVNNADNKRFISFSLDPKNGFKKKDHSRE